MWFGRRAEKRATAFSPTPYPVLAATSSFADVNLYNAESSLQSIAVRATTDLIASLASELPADTYEGEGRDRVKKTMPGYLEDPAGDGNGLPDWCYQVLMSWLLRGNLYGDVLERAPRAGFPTQVMLHHPDDVHGWLEDGSPKWTVNGRPIANRDQFWHKRVNPIPGRVVGLSPIEFAASMIGLSISSTKFGESWFRDGAHPSALLINEEASIDKDIARAAKDRFMAALRGNREPVVLGKGWSYKAIQISPEESQFLSTQGYTEAQCARIYGPGFAELLGYESGKSLDYANVESRSAHLLIYSMNKWLRRLDRLLSSMLPAGQYFRLNREGLLESTTLDRYKAYALALSNRWKTVNEVRENEDLQPVAWGNEPNPAGSAGLPDDETDKPKEAGT